MNVDGFNDMKEQFVSFASALITNVFPQPGGPCNKTPDGARSKLDPFGKSSGLVSGRTIDSFNISMVSSIPPISAQPSVIQLCTLPSR